METLHVSEFDQDGSFSILVGIFYFSDTANIRLECLAVLRNIHNKPDETVFGRLESGIQNAAPRKAKASADCAQHVFPFADDHIFPHFALLPKFL